MSDRSRKYRNSQQLIMNRSSDFRQSRSCERRSLLIAKYPIRILHFAEAGAILGCLLALGIHSIKNQHTRFERVFWSDSSLPLPEPSSAKNAVEEVDSDHDADGIPNEWEVTHSHNPRSAADAGSDFDQDGLTALQEYQLSLRTSGRSGNPLGQWKDQGIPVVMPNHDRSEYLYFYQNVYVSAANGKGDVVVQSYAHGQKSDGSWSQTSHPALLKEDGSLEEIHIPGKTSGFIFASDINEQGELLLQWYSPDWRKVESYLRKSPNSVNAITLDGNPCLAYRMNRFGDWIGYEITEDQGWLPVHAVDGMRMNPRDDFTSWSMLDINDYGQVIGTYHDVLEGRDLTFTQLGSIFFSTGREGDFPFFHESDQQWQWPAAMNRWGEFTGGSYGYTNLGQWRDSTFFFNGSYHDIKGRNESSYSYPVDLSDSGMVLFQSLSADSLRYQPFLWRDGVSVSCDALLTARGWTANQGYFEPTKVSANGKIFLTRYDESGLAEAIVILSMEQDSDGDGMPDDWEEFHGFNAAMNDSNLDADADGTNNLGEYLLRSDPNAAPVRDTHGELIDTRPGVDTDGDGIPNNWEVTHGMNYQDPSDAALDFDRDGYSNLQEFRLDTDPRGAPSYRIRTIGPFSDMRCMDMSGAILGDDLSNLRSRVLLADDVTEQVFLTAYPTAGGVRSSVWTQPRNSHEGHLSLYPSLNNGNFQIIARSGYGAVFARSSSGSGQYAYWASPNAVPVMFSGSTIENEATSVTSASFSPSGNFLYAMFYRATTGRWQPVAWKMPTSGGQTFKPVVITAPAGSTISSWMSAFINDHGIIAANGMVANQQRALVWSLNASATGMQGCILPNLVSNGYTTCCGISNQINPIIAGSASIANRQQRATVWKLISPSSFSVTNLGTLPHGDFSSIVKISPNGIVAGISTTLRDNTLKRQIFSASPITITNDASIDPSLYRMSPMGEPVPHSPMITHLTASGEILSSHYDQSSEVIHSLHRHGQSHRLDFLLPATSGYTLDAIKSINSHGALLVSAWKENALETILLTPDRDTDGDGLTDAFENSHQFNPFSKDNANADTDGDGLSDLQEYSNGTHPHNSDSDGDEMKDGWEVDWGFLPLDPSDASLDPDEDRVTNLRESQIGTVPTGIYTLETRHIDDAWQYPQILTAGDNGSIVITGAYSQNENSDGYEYGYEYNQEVSALLSSSSAIAYPLPSNHGLHRYDGDWSKYFQSYSWSNFYAEPTEERIHGERNRYHYRWDSAIGENFYEFARYLTPDITHFPDESDWISLETVEQNLRNPDLHNGKAPLDDSEYLMYESYCVSPSGIRRIHQADGGKQFLLNERGEFIAEMPSDHMWQKINDHGIAICYEPHYENSEDHSVPIFRPWLFLSNGQILLLPHDSSSSDWPDWEVLSFSNDGKALLRNGCKNEQSTWINRYFLFDSKTDSLNLIRLPACAYPNVSHLSQQNGRMLIQGSKPSLITPDGTCIRIDALRVGQSSNGNTSPIKLIYTRNISPNHITSDGRISLTVLNTDGKQHIIQLIPNNDMNKNGISDDWESSEILNLVRADYAQWSYLLGDGQLDAQTSYWNDKWDAKQSYLLGLNLNQRELSDRIDSDDDQIVDRYDADPLDKAVDWKPAAESSYAVISLEQLSYSGIEISNENDPYGCFSASIGDGGTVLWNDQIKSVFRDGREIWIERSRVWKSGEWSSDLRDKVNTFEPITLSGFYQPDPLVSPPLYEAITGAASPISGSGQRSDLRPSAVSGESIVGDGTYQGFVTNLKRIVRSYDDDGNEHAETLHDVTRAIESNNVSTVWTREDATSKNWQAKPIGNPPTGNHRPLALSEVSTDEWEIVDYRAVASPAGAVAVLGGNHTCKERKWQVWKASDNATHDSPFWEKPYRTEGAYSWGSQLLIKAVNDDGVAVGERISGMATFWGVRDAVVIQENNEEILPDSSGAFEMGACICQINPDVHDSHSRLAVGGSCLWVKRDQEWLKAKPRPMMKTIIAIAKDGVMLGRRAIWRNGVSIPLDDLVKNQKISDTNPKPRYTNLRAYAMNGEGSIVALADDAIRSTNAGKSLLMIVPSELVPDFNRDGKINNLDEGRVTEKKPWRFWVNDDDDANEYEGTDISYGLKHGPTNPDYSGNVVDGIRDIIDYFPLHIKIKEVLKIFPRDNFEYYIKHNTQTFMGGSIPLASFNILWYPEAELQKDSNTENALCSYLKNVNQAKKIALRKCFSINSEGLRIPDEMLNAAQIGQGAALIEARYVTNKPIQMEVRRKNGGSIFSIDFYASISSVQDMYRYGFYSPSKDGVSQREIPASPPNWPDNERNQKNFIFIHGYNVNPEQAKGWGSEIFKRMFWSGSNARFHLFSWYGYESQMYNEFQGSVSPNYQINIVNAFRSSHKLKQYIDFIGGETTVAAHSMGNIIMGSAMHDWGSRPRNYFMINSAAAKECYDKDEVHDKTQEIIMVNPWWKNYIKQVRASEWFDRVWKEGDERANLTWRGRLGRVLDNGGKTNVYNFYSSGEEVLNNPTVNDPDLSSCNPFVNGFFPWVTANKTWALQEKRKGWGMTGFIHTSNYGGWRPNLYPFYNSNLHIRIDNQPNLNWRMKNHNEIPNTSLDNGYAPFLLSLKQNPFFDDSEHKTLFHWDQGVSSEGSDYAKNWLNTIIAEMIPCVTCAAGSNSLKRYPKNKQFDMHELFMTDRSNWPERNRHDVSENLTKSWCHSDIREIAYCHNWNVYNKMISIGNLK